MSRRGVGIALTAAFAIAAVAAPVAADPHGGITRNLDKNGAFDYCNESAISNGRVVFGDLSAMNPLAGNASDNANTESSAIAPPQGMDSPCGAEGVVQRIEPRAFCGKEGENCAP